MSCRSALQLLILATLGAVGLGLAGIGRYGLVSPVVVARHKEIGIRMALGATYSRLVGTVLKDALQDEARLVCRVITICRSRVLEGHVHVLLPIPCCSLQWLRGVTG